MRTLARAYLLFSAVYALDFATSAFFISLGYGFAESNSAQRVLLASPRLGTFFSWVLNQNIRVALLAAGAIALAFPRIPAERLHLGFILGFCLMLTLYGVASNVAFILQVVAGVSLPHLGIYMLMSGLAMLSFMRGIREDFREAVRVLRSSESGRLG